MGRTGWNGNCIIDKMHPNRFESAGLIRNGENMGYPQMLTPTKEYIAYVVVIIIVSSLFGDWGRCGCMISHDHPNQGFWNTLLVAAYSVSGNSLCWWQKWRQNRKLAKIVRNCDEERINDKTNLKPILFIHTQAIPKPGKLLYACYVWSLCLCLVEFLCAQVSYNIRNTRNQGNYRIMHLVWFFWRCCYLADFWLIINGTLKGHVSYFCHYKSIIISPTCCQFHIQCIFLLCMEVRSSLISKRICIGKVDLCVYVSVDASLDHYCDERYFQSFYWQ